VAATTATRCGLWSPAARGHESVCSRAGVDDERRSFVNVAVVRSALVMCGLRTRLSTNADLQNFVWTQTDADPVP